MDKNPRKLRLNWPPRTDGGAKGPSERQSQFFNCSAKEQLYGGSKRGGKTVAGCAKAIYLSVRYPGNRGFILRNAFTDLRVSTLTTFFLLCPPELIISHNKADHEIKIRTNDSKHPSTIIYAGIGEESEDSPRAKEKAKSKDSGWFWIDEPSEVSFDAYRMMLAQLCWYLPDGTRPPYMALLTSNPEPGWVKDRFVDSSHTDYVIGKADAEWIPSLPADNPGLPPDWERDMRGSMDADWVRRYMDGSWDLHEGMVFTELSDELHNLDRFINPNDARAWSDFIGGFRHLSSLDHATTGITAYLRTGVDTSENLCAFEEYYQPDRLISEHATSIKSLDDRYPKPDYRLIDPSTEAKTLQGKHEMYSVQDAYAREGVIAIAAHRAEIHVGIDLIKELLHWNPVHIHPFLNQRGGPRLFISKSRCPNLWREMIGLKKVAKKDGTIEYQGKDHLVDDLRYIAMSRPQKAAQSKVDISRLPQQDQLAIRTHDSWSKKWDREANRNSGSWL
jgi:hypothetical protein